MRCPRCGHSHDGEFICEMDCLTCALDYERKEMEKEETFTAEELKKAARNLGYLDSLNLVIGRVQRDRQRVSEKSETFTLGELYEAIEGKNFSPHFYDTVVQRMRDDRGQVIEKYYAGDVVKDANGNWWQRYDNDLSAGWYAFGMSTQYPNITPRRPLVRQS
jgi:hypothetical protein